MVVGAGAVVGGVGQIFGASFEKKAATKARRARRRQAEAQIEQLLDQNKQQMAQSRQVAGRQRASFGAAGVRSNTGTAQAAQNFEFAQSILNQSRILKGVKNIREGIKSERRAVNDENIARTFGTFLSVLGGGFGGAPTSSPSAATTVAPAGATSTPIRNQGIGAVS